MSYLTLMICAHEALVMFQTRTVLSAEAVTAISWQDETKQKGWLYSYRTR